MLDTGNVDCIRIDYHPPFAPRNMTLKSPDIYPHSKTGLTFKIAGGNVNRDAPNQKAMIDINFNSITIGLFRIKNYFNE